MRHNAIMRAIVSAGVAGFPTGPYLGQCAGQCRSPNFFTAGATFAQMLSRSRHISRVTASSIQIAFPNWMTVSNNGGLETGPGGPATITASVVIGGSNSAGAISGGSAVIPVTWNGGSSSVTVADKETSPLSDPISVSVSPGTVIWVQCYYTNAAGIIYETGTTGSESQDSTNGEQFRFALSGLADQTGVKTAWTGGTSTTNLSYRPILIVATHSQPSVLIIGTSIALGFSSSARGTPGAPASSGEIGDKGVIARSIGGSIAYSQVAQGGSSLINWLTPGNFEIRYALRQYFSHVITDHGVNDILNHSPRTAAQIAADMVTFAAMFPTHRVYQTTCLPRTSGAWTAADGSDQTVYALANWATVRPDLNTLIRAGIAGFQGYFDTSAGAELAGASEKWHADGATAALMTADGLHPKTFGEQRIRSQGSISPALIVRP